MAVWQHLIVDFIELFIANKLGPIADTILKVQNSESSSLF